MGVCYSGDGRTRQINRHIQDERRQDEEVIKLLFLGAGGSGKSTLFKQLRLLHGDGLQLKERRSYTQHIYQNLTDGMKTLLEGNHDLYELSEENEGTGVKPVTHFCEGEVFDFFESLTALNEFSEETVKYFKTAWSNEGIKQTWENRSQLQVQDSLKYFIENIDRISEEGYVPSKDDVLHVRNRTSGIIEECLTIKDRPFKIVDVGGQRSERRKWDSCFDEVTGLIFVASLAAYNQLLYEDESTNRMVESLQIFKDTMTSKSFQKCCVILFLNKSDLFHEKIRDWPITSCFPNYKGPFTEDAQFNYIKATFNNQNTNSARNIFVHRTCATDTSHMKKIFDAVNKSIINQALILAGLIVAP